MLYITSADRFSETSLDATSPVRLKRILSTGHFDDYAHKAILRLLNATHDDLSALSHRTRRVQTGRVGGEAKGQGGAEQSTEREILNQIEGEEFWILRPFLACNSIWNYFSFELFHFILKKSLELKSV